MHWKEKIQYHAARRAAEVSYICGLAGRTAPAADVDCHVSTDGDNAVVLTEYGQYLSRKVSADEVAAMRAAGIAAAERRLAEMQAPIPIPQPAPKALSDAEMDAADGDLDGDEEPEAIIVSRHPATVEWIRSFEVFRNCRVISGNATAADVAGKIVAGNIPLHLAVVAESVYAVEFDGQPPRGTEYGIREMVAAGARLVHYKVSRA